MSNVASNTLVHVTGGYAQRQKLSGEAEKKTTTTTTKAAPLQIFLNWGPEKIVCFYVTCPAFVLSLQKDVEIKTLLCCLTICIILSTSTVSSIHMFHKLTVRKCINKMICDGGRCEMRKYMISYFYRGIPVCTLITYAPGVCTTPIL